MATCPREDSQHKRRGGGGPSAAKPSVPALAPGPSPLSPLYRYAESLKAAPFEGESLGQDEGSAFLMSMEEGPREPHK